MGKILLGILARLIHDITPEMREKLRLVVKDLQAKADETTNPVDDLFVGLLAAILGFNEA